MEIDMKLKKVKIMKVSVDCLFDMALKHVDSDDLPADTKLISCAIDPRNPTIVMMKIMSDSFEKVPTGKPFPAFHPTFKEKS